jgi:hypothetical protein
MTARHAEADRFHEIPDPAVRAVGRLPPEATLPAKPSPTRAERRRRHLLALGVSILWMAGLVRSFGVRHDIGTTYVVVLLALWSVAGVLGVALAFAPRDRGLPSGVRALQLLVTALPALFLATVLAATPAMTRTGASIPWEGTEGCLYGAILITAGPLALAALSFKRSFVSLPAWRGAAIGALCGLCGTIGIHTHCSVEATHHILIAHGLPIVLGTLAGAGLGALRGRL